MNDHIHLRGEIKSIQWSAEGLPESFVLDTNTRIEIPVASLIDPAAMSEGITVEVDGETDLNSSLATVQHAQVRVDGRLVADATQLPLGPKSDRAGEALTQVFGRVQSIAYQLGGAVDHIILENGLIVSIDPCVEVSDDLSIGDSIEVNGSFIDGKSSMTLKAESVRYVKNAH